MISNFPKPKKNVSRGFSLIEMIVAIGIFGIVVLIAVGSTLTIIGANQRVRAIKSVMTNLNFALDSIARDLRMGHTYQCGESVGGSCSNTAVSAITFVSVEGQTVVYKKSGNQILRNDIPIIDDENIQIDDLSFYITGQSTSDSLQPKVLLLIRGVASPDNEKARTEFNIQTTVSQRLYDKNS